MANRRILILDDDEAVGQTIQWIAEGLGFVAESVTRPEQFFLQLSRTKPDILSIDLAMPGFDGVEILRLLAELHCNAKIIISSGMGTRILEAAQRSASEHGLSIAGVIPKPFTKEAMRALIGVGSDLTLHGLDAGQATAAHRLEGAAVDRLEVTAADLQDALDRREFFIVYQPKIACSNGKVAGLEALVRWQHSAGCTVMPDEFIPIAEEAGLIDALTAQIFNQSLEWFSRSFQGSDLKLSLNVSAKSLVDINLVDNLFNICEQHGVAPECVVLELTETGAMVDPTLSLDLMTRFRVKGFQLSIDDFGTGYSSMVQLVRMPFSEIKVDKSFVMNLLESRESRTVVKSIIDLGHSLGLQVTAEGVEDRATFDYLTSLGCDLAQGYFIARPMPGEAVLTWLSERTPPKAG